MKAPLFATAAFGALTIGTVAHAADIPAALVHKAPPGMVYQDPPVLSLWEVDVGLRYWYSTGRLQKNLYNISGTNVVSRLTYGGLTANSGEAFFRADHWSKVFLKGYFGAGDVFRGNLTDEDFFSGGGYSSTNSGQRSGKLSYFDVDAGLTLYEDPRYRLGAFAGYHQWRETVSAFGCTSNVPGSVCDPPHQIPDSILVITQDSTWHSVRIGLVGDVKLTDRLKVSGEAAYVPRTYLTAADTHWLLLGQPGGGFSGPTPEDGRGSGVQLEATLSYQPTNWLTLAIGGRYWQLWTSQFSGADHYEISGMPPGSPQPVGFETRRYGAYLQSSVCLTCLEMPAGANSSSALKASAPAKVVPYSWTGFYVGPNAGYGFSNMLTSQSVDARQAAFFGPNGAVPQSIALQSDGFVGGVQAGYNRQYGYAVFGIESDIQYAHLKGGTTVVIGNGVFDAPFVQNISWLGTVRGRVGVTPTWLMGSSLFYATGGLAYGGTQTSAGLIHDVVGTCADVFNSCGSASISRTAVGWTGGGGIESPVWRNVTIKGEYLYVDLGSASMTYPFPNFGGVTPNFFANTHFRAQIVRLGLNYRFSMGDMSLAEH